MCVYWGAFPCGVSMCLDRCIISAPVIRQSSWHSWPWWGLEQNKFSAPSQFGLAGGTGTAAGGDDYESGLLSRARDGIHEGSGFRWIVAPTFNKPELSPFSPWAHKTLLSFLHLRQPYSLCGPSPRSHQWGTWHPSHQPNDPFPLFSVCRHSQTFTDVLPQKASEKSEALGPSSAPLCNL